MHPVITFLFAPLYILFPIAKLRLHPFLSFFLISIPTGVLTGESLATVEAIRRIRQCPFPFCHYHHLRERYRNSASEDWRNVFNSLGYYTFFRKSSARPESPLFPFSVPLICYTLAYVVFFPITKELAARLDNPSISTATALGAVVSFIIVYPSPVVISAPEELSANADRFFIPGFLIAIPTSIAGYLYARRLGKTEPESVSK